MKKVSKKGLTKLVKKLADPENCGSMSARGHVLSDALRPDHGKVHTNEMGAQQSDVDYDFTCLDKVAMSRIAIRIGKSGLNVISPHSISMIRDVAEHLNTVLIHIYSEQNEASLCSAAVFALAAKEREINGYDPVSVFDPLPTDFGFACTPPKALFAVAKILHRGAKKYGKDNWRGISVQENLNHAEGHIRAWLAGDGSDDHLGNVCCRTIFALAVYLQGGPIKQKKVAGK
jgi:hypothetical protein